jgi:negative regulator of sigma-B (phosphoserine phosphatase)
MTGTATAAAADRSRNVIAWGVASAPFPNERESGDRYVVQPSANGVLIAAVDGNGHGAEAAAAAKIAAATLEAHALESPIALVLRCHEELKATRGAVMTLAFVDLRDRTLNWLGVGNVEAALFHRRRADTTDRVLLRAGIIGFRLPPVRAEIIPLKPFDTLIIATDGISPDFDLGLTLDGDPQQIADGILARHHSGIDDALVVVARYLGGEREQSPA